MADKMRMNRNSEQEWKHRHMERTHMKYWQITSKNVNTTLKEWSKQCYQKKL